MDNKELNEMEENDCMFFLEEPEVIYTPYSFSDGRDIAEYVSEKQNNILLWITKNFDPEGFIREVEQDE